MKIVFLDIDGVLNFRGTPTLHDPCLDLVRWIAAETGAKFVLTSSWRESLFGAPTCEVELGILDTLLYRSGLEFIGWTPWDPLDMDRREVEIQMWLDSFHGVVDSFVILDDLDYDFESVFPGRFVQTAGWDSGGLQAAHAVEAIQILNSV